MIWDREGHACSSFWLNGDQIVVVSPGRHRYGTPDNATEFLNLNQDQEYPYWIRGAFCHFYKINALTFYNEVLF